MRTERKTAVFPAGEYWIGDLCYVLHDEWKEICNDFLFADDDFNIQEGEYTLKNGTRIFMGSTAYGDGVYQDNDGNDYGVDSGSIGIVKLSSIDQTNKQNYTFGGHIHIFESDFEVSYIDGQYKSHYQQQKRQSQASP